MQLTPLFPFPTLSQTKNSTFYFLRSRSRFIFSLQIFAFLIFLPFASQAESSFVFEIKAFDIHSNPQQSLPTWLNSWQVEKGTRSPTDGSWSVASDQPIGEGQIVLYLNPTEIKSDLAITLSLEANEDSDLGVQLLDDNNQIIHPDVFGNLIANAEAVGTDTFIIPLNKYPQASAISIRRISGSIRINQLTAYPVLQEVTNTPSFLRRFNEQLEGELSPLSPFSFSTSPEKEAPQTQPSISSKEEQILADIFVQSAAQGDLTKAQILLNNGLSISSVNSKGLNALHAAVIGNHPNMIRLLVERGIPLNSPIEDQSETTALHLASIQSPLNTITYLLLKGADPNAVKWNGRTPLMECASIGNTVTLQTLIQNGAHLNLIDQNGETALDIAIRKGHLKAVRLLRNNRCLLASEVEAERSQ